MLTNTMNKKANTDILFNITIATLMIGGGLIVAIGYLNLGGLLGGIGAIIVIIKSLLEKGILT